MFLKLNKKLMLQDPSLVLKLERNWESMIPNRPNTHLYDSDVEIDPRDLEDDEDDGN